MAPNILYCNESKPMKIFNINNKQHIRILKEEIQRLKYILKEAKQYSADEIWTKMSPDDRKTVLYVAKELTPNKYINSTWDEISPDLQDLLDISDYELAVMSPMGMSSIRAIKKFIADDSSVQQLISKFLKKINRQTLEDITYKHANYLNAVIQKYLAAKNPNPTMSVDVTNIDWKDYDGTSNSRDWRGGRIS